jgi:hypothetical protein
MTSMKRFMLAALSLALLVVPLTASARVDGPTVVVADGQGGGSFELIGHSSLDMRGMNAALAVRGDYAYIGSRTDGGAKPVDNGIKVVDVSDPSKPEVVHTIGQPYEDNEGETSREMRIWHEQELLIVMNLGSNCSELIHACSPRGVDDNFRFYDISGKHAAEPKFVAEYLPSVNPHEMFLWEDPKNPKRALLYLSTPGGATQVLVTDISAARQGKFVELGKQSFLVGESGNDNRLHSLTVTPDGNRATFGYLEAGFYVADTSDFARAVKKPTVKLITDPKTAPSWADEVGPGAHSAVPLFGTDHALVTDEVYGEALRALDSGGCPWGWTRMIDTSDPKKPKVVAEFKLPQNDPDFCTTDAPRPSSSYSAHNPTVTENLAFVTWHSAGLQAIDVSDPTKPTQAAEFIPQPEPVVMQEDPALSAGQDKVVMWSFPVIQDGLIYVVDLRNGLYILKYKGPFESEVSKVNFLEGNSNQGDAVRLGKL